MKHGSPLFACHGMPLAGLGMLAGMAADAGQGGFILLADLCAGPRPPSFLDLLRLHWLCLPFMHAGMVVAGLLAAALAPGRAPGAAEAARRVLAGLSSSAWMILGMNLGGHLLLRSWFPLEDTGGGAPMAAAMTAGMAAAMLAWARLSRLCGPRPAPRRPKHPLHDEALP